MSTALPSSASSKSLRQALDSPARLQEIFAALRDGEEQQQDGIKGSADNDRVDGDDLQQQLERRLALSAQLGLALLEKQGQLVDENKALLGKQRELEASISQLLDRLAQSYKENAQLIKRAERANANMDASEASNRQLLITLEEDRKIIRRLNAKIQRVTATDGGNHTTSNNNAAGAGHAVDTQLEELKMELDWEKRRGNAAEARARRAAAKLVENESRLSNLTNQLERTTEAGAGRHAISHSRNRSRPGSINLSHSNPVANNKEETDLLAALHALRNGEDQPPQASTSSHSDNEMIPHYSAPARLDAELRLQGITNTSGDDSLRYANEESLDAISETVRSPGASSEPSTSTAPTSTAAHDWMPTPHVSNLMGRLPHTSNDSTTNAALLPPLSLNASITALGGSRLGNRRRSQPRVLTASALRKMGGRAMSVDLTNLMHRRYEDTDSDAAQARSPSPNMRGAVSPILRPFALAASVNSLSSSLGSPALPTAHEDSREAETDDDIPELEEGPTILEIEPTPAKTPFSGVGNLSKTSPTKSGGKGLGFLHPAGSSRSNESMLPVETREIGTQTESQQGAVTASHSSIRPTFRQYTSSILSSDADAASEPSGPISPQAFASIGGESMSNLQGVLASGGTEASLENKTAAVGTLVDYVLKLAARLKGADISSLEQRLKRQNLPGDVGHLAKNTMRDIFGEITGMRNHFRQILEQETALFASEEGKSLLPAALDTLMARKDFFVLVKLFKDLLHELGRLRLIVNRVELEPQWASRLRDIDGLQSPADLMSANPLGTAERGTAATLLAPLSRLFYGNEQQQQASTAANGRITYNRSSSSSARMAPKLSASSALAAATVNVEFGGQGGIRRQVSIMPQDNDGGLKGRYNSLGKGSTPQDARESRRDISSIFAGGAGLHPDSAGGGEGGWVKLPSNPASRQTSYSGAPGSRQHAQAYQPMSKAVAAVIDHVDEDEEFQPNLLERTLRPRGLSDSSIHSTYRAHANPSNRLLTPSGGAVAISTNRHGDETVKATIAASPRPSVFGLMGGRSAVRARPPPSPYANASASGRDSATGSEASSAHAAAGTNATTASSGHRTATSSTASKPSGSKPIAGSGGYNDSLGSPSSHAKSPVAIGGTGLLANLGAWAARGTFGSSYVEPSSLSSAHPLPSHRPGPSHRAVSNLIAPLRKQHHREPEL